MMKRISAIAMALVIMIAMVPAVPVDAATTTDYSANFKYTSAGNNTYEIAGYEGNAENISIPSKIGDITVTSIASNAFSGANISNSGVDLIQTVGIPNTIVNIGNNAFKNCTGLTTVTVPGSVVTLGTHIFYGCSGLKSAVIESGVKEITNNMFANCTALETVTIPASVTQISDSAFKKCISLKTVYYAGTQSQWQAIDIVGTDNVCLTNSKVQMYYSSSGTSSTQTSGTNTNSTSGTNSNTPTTTATTTTTTTTTTEVVSIKSCTITVPSTFIYTGKAITPEPTVTYNGKTLIKDIHYTLSYTNNTNVGTAAVTVTGKDDYTSKDSVAFSITAATLAGATITLDAASVTYDGTPKQPAIKSVTLNGTTLKADTDYTVSYSNNTSVGTGTVTITGTGNYTGTASTTFAIGAISIANASASLDTKTYNYDGTAKQPKFSTVKLNSIELKEGTDYTVSYKDNIEAGSGTATLTGKGNYTGTLTRIFVIQRSLDGAVVTLAGSSYEYTGTTKKPSVESVTLGGTTLVAGTDYSVSYQSNKNIGTATAVVTGKGCYKGKATTTFEIVPRIGATFTTGVGKYKVTGSDSVAFTGLNKAATKSLTIPASVTYGGKSFLVTAVTAKALKKTNITKLVIGKNVTEIGTSVCEGCANLKSVTVGASVMTIGSKAFKNCKKLAKINIESTVLTEVGSKALSGIKSTAKIYVPADLYDSYEELLSGKGQGKKVKIQ